MTADWQTFVEQRRQEKYLLEDEQLAALETFFANPDTSITDIAYQFAQQVLESLKQRSDNPIDCYILWQSINLAVRQLTAFNDRLVELVIEYQKIKSPKDYIAYMTDYHMHMTEFGCAC